MTAKLARLKRIIKSYKGMVLAYSGGVDSSFLMKVAADVLNKRLVCVTASSALYPKAETDSARRLARQLKVKHLVIKTRELSRSQFTRNPPMRCYYCKKELFGRLKKIARPFGYVVADATNFSDRTDFRPGSRAAVELGIKSPLAQARFTKDEIRQCARKFGLPNWSKPALACLASRIPYGTRITTRLVARINKAEAVLGRLGFKQVRVRAHGPVARIEINRDDFGAIIRCRQVIVNSLRRLGFDFVTLDLAGYATGSMNRLLTRHTR